MVFYGLRLFTFSNKTTIFVGCQKNGLRDKRFCLLLEQSDNYIVVENDCSRLLLCNLKNRLCALCSCMSSGTFVDSREFLSIIKLVYHVLNLICVLI